MKSAAEAPLMLSLFDFLKARGIPYVLLGDATVEQLNDRENDYDLVLPHEVLSDGGAWIRAFCLQRGAILVQSLQHEATAIYYVLAERGTDGYHYYKVDCCSDYGREGRIFLSAEQLLADAQTIDHDVQVPSVPNAFIYYLLKKISKPHPITDIGYLQQLWGRACTACIIEIERFFTAENNARDIVEALDGGDAGALEQRREGLRRALWRSPAVHKNVRDEALRRMRRLVQPTGLMLAVLGPDGSGKSTVMAEVEARLANAFRHTRTYHLRPPLFGQRGDGAPVVNPHGEVPRGVGASLLKLLYWWTEYWVGYWLTIKPAMIRSTLVLFDRYYDDLFIDPKRYRWGISLSLPRWGRLFVPKPDMTFILLADVETLWARKKEVAKTELAGLVAAYRAWGNEQGYRIIDAGRDVNAVAGEIEEYILIYMAERMAQRSAASPQSTAT